MSLAFAEHGLAFDGWQMGMRAYDGDQLIVFRARRPLLRDIFGFSPAVADMTSTLLERRPLIEVACVRAYGRARPVSMSVPDDVIYIELEIGDFPDMKVG